MSLKPVTGFKYAPKKSPGCTVEFAQYVEGGLAMTIWDGPERQATATVNLAPYGSRKLAPDEVWLKGWAENEGLPEALERAGFVILTGETMPAGTFVVAHLAKLTPEALEAAIHTGYKPG